MLDILTPKGQESRLEELKALAILKKEWPSYSFFETPKDKPASLDHLIAEDGTLKCGVEIKCRNMTLQHFTTVFDSTWLITDDKLVRCQQVCAALCIPFFGALYLVPDGKLLTKMVWSPDTGETEGIVRKWTETQKTVNGGVARRLNAYIPMNDAKHYGP